MAQWAVTIPADRWATERLFRHDTLTVPGSPTANPLPGDEVLLVAAGDQPQAVALGTVRAVHHAAAESPEDGRVARAARSPEGGPAPGDAEFAEGGIAAGDAEALLVAYTRRAFDEPVPAEELKLDQPVVAIEAEVFQRLAARLGGDCDRLSWLVSVALPIEATNAAEAVRQFWSHVVELGPAELPTYVWPADDELAMQAFVLGVEANQDPEEDED